MAIFGLISLLLMLSHPLIVSLGPPLPWLDVEHKPYELIISIITSSSELRSEDEEWAMLKPTYICYFADSFH